MLLKLAALGALGFVGYRYAQKSGRVPGPRLAGGPLSQYATVQHTADEPPPVNPYRG